MLKSGLCKKTQTCIIKCDVVNLATGPQAEHNILCFNLSLSPTQLACLKSTHVTGGRYVAKHTNVPVPGNLSPFFDKSIHDKTAQELQKLSQLAGLNLELLGLMYCECKNPIKR